MTIGLTDQIKIATLRIKLAEKEAKLESLLKSINAVSSKLVRAGILPSVPGLFFAPPEHNSTLSISGTDGPSDQVSKRNDDQYKGCPAWTKLTRLEAMFPKRKSQTDGTPLTTHAVSNALRTLIGNMEQFKTYLIQVEDCRSKLSQLEKAQRATEACLRMSHKFDQAVS